MEKSSWVDWKFEMNEIKYLQQGLVQNEYLQSKMCVSIYIYIYI